MLFFFCAARLFWRQFTFCGLVIESFIRLGVFVWMDNRGNFALLDPATTVLAFGLTHSYDHTRWFSAHSVLHSLLESFFSGLMSSILCIH